MQMSSDELDSCGDLNHIRSQEYDSVVGVFWQQVLSDDHIVCLDSQQWVFVITGYQSCHIVRISVC